MLDEQGLPKGSIQGATKSGRWQDRYVMWLRATDIVVIAAAVALAQYLRFGISPAETGIPESRQFLHSFVLMLLWLSALAIFNTRDPRVLGSGVDEYKRVVSATFWIFGFIAIGSLLLKLGPSRIYLAVALPFGTAGLLVARWLWRKRVLSRRRRGECMNALVVIGEAEATAELISRLSRIGDDAYRVIGVGLEGDRGEGGHFEVVGRRFPILGDDEQALEALDEVGATSVALAGPERMGSLRLRYLLWDLERRGLSLLVSPTASPLVIEPVPGYPLMQVKNPHYAVGRRLHKRAFDVIFAAVALAFFLPVLLLAAIAIKVTTRGPVIYREERIGLGGTTFQMMKLRTIQDAADCGSDVTVVGRALRRLNLDEIPVLLNVLKGDMSVVGPPPMSGPGADDSGTREFQYLRRPGITGVDMKRILDLFLVLLTSPVWLPLLILIGLVKFLADGAPLLYLSKRVGREGVPFTVYKFRTMVDDPAFIQNEIAKMGKIGFEAIPIDSLVYTRMGRIFERFQFVELPQLLNILKGDMSLIGYRPLPAGHVVELEHTVGREQVTGRHTHAPGLTGFAQLSGKALLSNKARLEIEIAEAKFFSASSWSTSAKVYFMTICATGLYVILGSNEFALNLRDKYLKEYMASSASESDAEGVEDASDAGAGNFSGEPEALSAAHYRDR